MNNRELVYSWMCDEESRYIFEKRYEYVEKGNYKAIEDILEKYVPEYEELKKFYEKIDNKKIWIWGAGDRLKIIGKFMYLASQPEVCGIIDTKKINMDIDFLGNNVKVISPRDVDFSKIDCLVISIKDSAIINEVVKEAINHGMKGENIVVFGEYFLRDRLIERQYFDEIVTCNQEEIFVDAGVCDLCTSFMFFEWCKKHNVNKMKSIAFEPDPISFELCEKEKLKHSDYDIELVKLGLYSEATTLKFLAKGNSSSCIVNDVNGISIDVTSLDSYANEKITFIKMDIEGAELAALRGCKNVILRDRPKLAISVYHKPEDIVEIPMYIKTLVPDYNIYMRHYSFYEGETVLYALPY